MALGSRSGLSGAGSLVSSARSEWDHVNPDSGGYQSDSGGPPLAWLRFLGRLGGTHRPCRGHVDALVPVIPANAIARGRCLTHHLLYDAGPRRPLGRLRLNLDAIPDLQLHLFTSDSPRTGDTTTRRVNARWIGQTSE